MIKYITALRWLDGSTTYTDPEKYGDHLWSLSIHRGGWQEHPDVFPRPVYRLRIRMKDTQ